MALRVTGQNLDIGDALKIHVDRRVADAMSKYFDRDYSGQITIRKEGPGFRTDCYISLPTGLTLQTEAAAHDPHASVDQAVERLAKRLKRYRDRIRNYHPADASQAASSVESVIQAPSDDDAGTSKDGEFVPVVVAESTSVMKKLSVSEAVVELDLTGAGALVFAHAGHGRVNVVYRRPDGHIGWLDLPAGSDTVAGG